MRRWLQAYECLDSLLQSERCHVAVARATSAEAQLLTDLFAFHQAMVGYSKR